MDLFDGLPAREEDEISPDRIAVGPIANAVKTSSLSMDEIAFDIGMRKRVRKRGGRMGESGDGTRVKRALGMSKVISRTGEKYYNSTIDYDLAVQIVRAAGVWPVDADL